LFTEEPPREEPAEGPPRGPLFGRGTGALARLIPTNPEAQQSIQKELLRAGFYHRSALIDYLAVRSLLTILPLILALEGALLTDNRAVSMWLAGYGVLLAVAGFCLPRYFLRMRGNRRGAEIKRALPLAQDLIALCLQAGVNLVLAFGHVARQMKATHPVLASELSLTHQQAQLRSLGHGLTQMADRIQVSEASTFAHTLQQSEELGTDAAVALHELSDHQRRALRTEAEAQANRTSFWMLFPTVGCLYLSVAIMLIAPGILELVREGPNVQKYMQETQSLMNEANNPELSADRLLNPGGGP
jgi:tight adherence protein C